MKQIIDKIKAEIKKKGFNRDKIVPMLKGLREYFKENLKQPGLVVMIRLAYENIESNGEYTFLYLEEEKGKVNLEYFIDLLADYSNKYNSEELKEIRNLMEGKVPEDIEENEI